MEEAAKKNNLSEFLKGSSILVISNVCLKAMNFFLLPLYTKYLSTDQLGISDSITTLTGFLLPVFTLGLDSAFSAFYFDKKDPERGKKVFSTLAFTFLFLGMAALVCSGFSGLLSRLLFHSEEYRWLILAAFGSMAINLWYMPYSLELRLKNRMFAFGVANVSASFTMILLNILFVAVLKMGEQALILSSLLANVLQLILLIFFVHTGPKRKDGDRELLGKMLRYSLPLVPMSALNWVLSLSDRYVLLAYHGEGIVGVYGIALRFVTVLNVIISAVSMAYTTFAFQAKDSENAKKQYYQVFQVEALLLMGISFTVTLFGPEVIDLMSSDPAYLGASDALRDLLFAQTVFALSGIVGYGINFAKKSGFYLLAVAAGAGANFLLNLWLIPEYGMKAAAATTLIGYLIVFILVYVFSERLYPCRYGLVRVAGTMGVLYGLTILTADMALWVRALVFAGAAAGTCFIFRDTIRGLVHFLGQRLRRKNRKENT